VLQSFVVHGINFTPRVGTLQGHSSRRPGIPNRAGAQPPPNWSPAITGKVNDHSQNAPQRILGIVNDIVAADPSETSFEQLGAHRCIHGKLAISIWRPDLPISMPGRSSEGRAISLLLRLLVESRPRRGRPCTFSVPPLFRPKNTPFQ